MPNQPNGLMGTVRNMMPSPGNVRDWRQWLDMGMSAAGIPGDWYNSQTRQWNNPMQALGVNGLMNMFRPGTAPAGPGFPAPGGPGTNMSPAYNGPGSDAYQPAPPGAGGEENPFQGDGPQRGYGRSNIGRHSPAGQRGGAAGSQTVAEGQGAQDMVGAMRDGSNRAQLDAQAAEIRRRMDRLAK